MEDTLYRKGVLTIIFNTQNQFLIVQLKDYKDNEWNFPGGGLEPDETYENAVYREIEEEVALHKEDLVIVGKSSTPIKYDFPPELIEINKQKGRNFIGQIKEIYCVLYSGAEKDITFQEKEIRDYKWVSREELSKYLVFRNQYDQINKVLIELNSQITGCLGLYQQS